LGPAIPPVSRIRGKNRVQFILKSKKKRELDAGLRKPLKMTKVRKSVYVRS
jgi:primosomal protein N' (replication factor Y)